MKININYLELRNFKGIKHLKINFKSKTDIFGENKSGKTTIFDAFTWLLFGKDSTDRKDFSIKTLEENGEPRHKLDHEVSGLLEIDGIELTLKRIFREKWQKKRGEAIPEFTGNETLYFINDVPVSQKDYQAKIDSIISEQTFKLLTSPTFFNSTMKWQDRRKMLFEMAGEISDNEIADSRKEFEEILNSDKNLDELKKETAAKRRKLNETLKEIPSRIDEISRNMSSQINVKDIENQISEIDVKLKEIDSQISDRNQAYEDANKSYIKSKNKISELKRKLIDSELGDQLKANSAQKEKENKIKSLKSEVESNKSNYELKSTELSNKKNNLDYLTKEREKLLEKWHELNSIEFAIDQNELVCPTCNRPFDENMADDKISKMKSDFNENKSQQLNEITENGKSKNKSIELLKDQIQKLEKEISDIVESNENLESELDAANKIEINSDQQPNSEIENLSLQIKALESQLPDTPKVDISDFKSQKDELNSKRDLLKADLTRNESREKSKTRIKELENEEKSLCQQIANLEKIEFSIDQFMKLKIETIEKRINEKFDLVKFKMYRQFINGGEEEICEALIDGVPYQDANNASKINSGIDIINTFSEHFDVYAPIFIDNAEAVNKLIDTECQFIRLVVIEPPTEKDKIKYKQQGLLLERKNND